MYAEPATIIILYPQTKERPEYWTDFLEKKSLILPFRLQQAQLCFTVAVQHKTSDSLSSKSVWCI